MSPSWLKVALVALGLAVVPVYAFADGTPEAAPLDAKERKNAEQYPMTSAKFMEKVDARIAKKKERVAARLEKHNVPAEKRKAVMAEVDAGAVKVRAAAEQAGRDGTVTAEEAQGVRKLAKQLRKDAREKFGKGKNGKGKKGKKGKAA